MATRAEPVRIGPFTGGLNTYSDPSAVADEDVVDLINFEVDLDGSLISRPPFVRSTVTTGARYASQILGIYTTAAGVSYIIFSGEPGGTYAYNINTNTFSTITTTIRATAMVQYLNKAWLVAPPGSANPGGSWDATTFTAVASMAKGGTATLYKERIFVGSGGVDTTNPSRLYFSGPANPSSWTGTDFLDISNGDGQSIVKIYTYSNSVVIFKTRSTYVFAYESSPTKGQVQIISASIGIDGLNCLAESEGVLYVMSGSDIYGISNWNWEQLNVKVPFAYVNDNTGNTSTDFSVSVINNRLICRYFSTYYVYGLKTRAWTKWFSVKTPDFWVRSPIMDTTSNAETFFAGNFLRTTSTNPERDYFYTFMENYSATRAENFTCTLRTKVFSMNVPYSFKRLMWWGVDLLTKSQINASVLPITYGKPVRIMDLAGKTIADLANQTVGAPLDISIQVDDVAAVKNQSSVRMFIRFIKSLRFRQVQFVLTSNIDGTTATGPLQIYSLTGMVINKESVTKKIN